MNYKYYRLLEGDKGVLQDGDVHVRTAPCKQWIEATECAGEDISSQDDVYFRPITLPRVGWLPIGEKKEFEKGTLFALRIDGRMERFTYHAPTISRDFYYYLPPLPVDGVKDLTMQKDQLISSMSHDAEVSLKALQNATAHISELEESLRKAEEEKECFRRAANKWRGLIEKYRSEQSPAWQELATFEGDVPAGWLVVAEDGCSMWTVTPDSAAFWISRKFKWCIASPQKPDNSAKIAELENEQSAIRTKAAACHKYLAKYTDRGMKIESEIAKLKERK